MGSQLTATWVSAIGSAGSLLGFASYVWIMLLNRKDQAEVRQEQQAQSVSAWLDEGARHDRDEDYVVCAHNSGDAPVFDCSLEVARPDEDEPHRARFAIIPPGATAVRALPFGEDAMPVDDLYSAAAVPGLSFTDSRGGHWTRDTSGVLSRADRRSVRGRWRSGS
ncbi:hypothetical protein [Amycolatopsis sp. La24]|uniref:hypothetical protein n=1 Tax=Amycolatopsis sp. La24 TaxID=3028304 RepID=UPI0023B1FDB0|nr:hypothetical protein [Amycolatopsis sp. La24]